MTENGKAYAIMRLSECPTKAALERVWNSLGIEYRRHPCVKAHKDRLKEVLK